MPSTFQSVVQRIHRWPGKALEGLSMQVYTHVVMGVVSMATKCAAGAVVENGCGHVTTVCSE